MTGWTGEVAATVEGTAPRRARPLGAVLAGRFQVDHPAHLLLLCALVAAPAMGASSGEPPSATIEVVPGGGWAEVLIDGSSHGLGPLKADLSPGKHLIELAETDYHVKSSRVVWVGPGEQLEITMARTLKTAWLEPRGFPSGTWVEVDGGPGPLLQAGTRIAIADGLVHEFHFRFGEKTLREVALQRCIEDGCLLPGDARVEVWDSRGRDNPATAPPAPRHP